MDNVVYILGAGFSAPLGLPVMSNFIEMSRNLYASDKKRYEHFGRVFDNIRKKLAYITLFYKSNLDNIEEVLSILEMERLAGKVSEEETNEYIRYIVDVIQYFTPPIVGLNHFERTDEGTYKPIGTQARYEHELRSDFIQDMISASYSGFVCNLFNGSIKTKGLDLAKKKTQYDEFEIRCEINENPSFRYSVITLNYDLVLENHADYLSQNTVGEKLKFIRPEEKSKQGSPILVKLHGSADTTTVIPPTWNKTITPHIEREWETAYQLLSSANYIRIIGYSLPDSDAYVRYLLKASILN